MIITRFAGHDEDHYRFCRARRRALQGLQGMKKILTRIEGHEEDHYIHPAS
jgi:hypothetical protein